MAMAMDALLWWFAAQCLLFVFLVAGYEVALRSQKSADAVEAVKVAKQQMLDEEKRRQEDCPCKQNF